MICCFMALVASPALGIKYLWEKRHSSVLIQHFPFRVCREVTSDEELALTPHARKDALLCTPTNLPQQISKTLFENLKVKVIWFFM